MKGIENVHKEENKAWSDGLINRSDSWWISWYPTYSALQPISAIQTFFILSGLGGGPSSLLRVYLRVGGVYKGQIENIRRLGWVGTW